MAQDLKIDIVAQDRTSAAFRSVQNGLSNVQSTASSLITKISALTAVLATIGAGASIKGIIEAGDRLDELSKRTNIAVETLSALTNNAKLAGVSQDDLATGITRLSKAIAEGISDAGEQRQAFENLGVSLTDANGKARSTVDILGDVAAAFQSSEDSVYKTQYAMAIFGKSGANFIEFLNQGREGVQALGASISTEFADKSATFMDNLDKIGIVIQRNLSERASPFIAFLNRQLEKVLETEQKIIGAGGGRGFVNPEFVKPQEEVKKELKPLTTTKVKEEKDSVKELAQAYQQVTDEIIRLVDGEKELMVLQFARKGATEDQIAAYRQYIDQLFTLRQAEKDAEEEAKVIQEEKQMALKANADLLAEAKKIYDETRTPLEQLAATEERLQKLLSLGVINWDTYGRAIMKANEDIDNLKDNGIDSFAQLEAAIKGWGDQFNNTLTDAVMTGKISFKSLADSIISDILRMMIYKSITAPLMESAGNFFGFSTSGKRAMGGPVTAGRSYLVGENGPEIFTPSQTGGITPNGVGGGVSVNIVNNSGAQASAKQSVDSRGNRRIDVTIGDLVANELLRNGSNMNQALRSGFGASPMLVGR